MAEDLSKLWVELAREAKAHAAAGTELSHLLKSFEGTLATVGARMRAGAEETAEEQKLPLQIEYDRAGGNGQWSLYYRIGRRTPEGPVFDDDWTTLRDAAIPIKIRAVELLPSLLKHLNLRLRASTRRIEPAAKKMRALIDGMKEGA